VRSTFERVRRKTRIQTWRPSSSRSSCDSVHIPEARASPPFPARRCHGRVGNIFPLSFSPRYDSHIDCETAALAFHRDGRGAPLSRRRFRDVAIRDASKIPPKLWRPSVRLFSIAAAIAPARYVRWKASPSCSALRSFSLARFAWRRRPA